MRLDTATCADSKLDCDRRQGYKTRTLAVEENVEAEPGEFSGDDMIGMCKVKCGLRLNS